MARILVIAYTTYAFDGRVKRHAEALAARGDEVDVLCLDHEAAGRKNGVNVIGLRIPRYRGASRSSYVRSYLRFFLTASWLAMRLSRKNPYDVAVVCTMPDAAVLCALPARLCGTRVLLDMHDTMPELYEAKFGGRRGALGARILMLIERLSTFCADAVVAVHDLHRLRLIRAGVDANKIRVVMNVPDLTAYRPPHARIPTDKHFNVVCHGTITHRLGLDIAINAVSLTRHRLPDLRLLVIGNGDYRDQAKALVAQLKLDDRVSFGKAVPTEQLPDLLARAHIGLVPNRENKATNLMLPVKLLDYAALGIPAIASRLDTIEHYFDASAVKMFQPGRPDALAAAIEELYGNEAKRRELAINARKVVERIGWTKQRAEYYQAIDSLMRQPNVSSSPPAGSRKTAHEANRWEEPRWNKGRY